MSTRSIIIVTGKGYSSEYLTFRISKHSDGYPTDVFDKLSLAIEEGEKLMKEHAAKWISDAATIMLHPSVLVGKFMAADISAYGMGAYVEETYYEPFNPKHLGSQSDLEWIYVVNTDNKTVAIYGGGYTGKIPQEALKNGIVDPLIYVKCLYEEYQEKEKNSILRYMAEIECLGYSFVKDTGSLPLRHGAGDLHIRSTNMKKKVIKKAAKKPAAKKPAAKKKTAKKPVAAPKKKATKKVAKVAKKPAAKKKIVKKKATKKPAKKATAPKKKATKKVAKKPAAKKKAAKKPAKKLTELLKEIVQSSSEHT